jgi:hypothetical protein
MISTRGEVALAAFQIQRQTVERSDVVVACGINEGDFLQAWFKRQREAGALRSSAETFDWAARQGSPTAICVNGLL